MTETKINFSSSEVPDWKSMVAVCTSEELSSKDVLLQEQSLQNIYLYKKERIISKLEWRGMSQRDGTLLLQRKAEIVGAAQPGQEGIPGRAYNGLSVGKES